MTHLTLAQQNIQEFVFQEAPMDLLRQVVGSLFEAYEKTKEVHESNFTTLPGQKAKGFIRWAQVDEHLYLLNNRRSENGTVLTATVEPYGQGSGNFVSLRIGRLVLHIKKLLNPDEKIPEAEHRNLELQDSQIGLFEEPGEGKTIDQLYGIIVHGHTAQEEGKDYPGFIKLVIPSLNGQTRAHTIDLRALFPDIVEKFIPSIEEDLDEAAPFTVKKGQQRKQG